VVGFAFLCVPKRVLLCFEGEKKKKALMPNMGPFLQTTPRKSGGDSIPVKKILKKDLLLTDL